MSCISSLTHERAPVVGSRYGHEGVMIAHRSVVATAQEPGMASRAEREREIGIVLKAEGKLSGRRTVCSSASCDESLLPRRTDASLVW